MEDEIIITWLQKRIKEYGTKMFEAQNLLHTIENGPSYARGAALNRIAVLIATTEDKDDRE